MIAWLFALAAAAPAVSASAPEQEPLPPDFARSWSIETAHEDGAYRITLDEDVYRHALHPDLADLVAFDARAAPVPFGPVPRAPDAAPALVVTDVALPWFRVPRPSSSTVDETIEMQFTRGADGRLVPAIRATATTGLPGEDVILDASALQGGIDRLELALSPPAGEGLDARVELLASDDLASWRLVAEDAALVSLEHDGHRLVRNALELDALDASYLLLRRIDGGTLPITGAIAQVSVYAPGTPPVERATISPAPRGTEAPGAFAYDSGGPFPIERVRVELVEPNSVVTARVESRAGPAAAWRTHVETTAFRVLAAGSDVANLAHDVGTTRDREWRVVTSPPLSIAPRLVLDYRPDAYLLLAQGTPPYRIAAGSATQRRAAYPLERLLAELHGRVGAGWSPRAATLGAGHDIAGGPVAPARPRLPWLRWALWLVLAGGAGGIVLMVARLLRERGDDPGRAPER